jgi:hypothetical protein
MNKLKEQLINKAKDRFKKISPCPTRKSLRESFTVENNNLYFWFNTEDKSTHVLAEKLA